MATINRLYGDGVDFNRLKIESHPDQNMHHVREIPILIIRLHILMTLKDRDEMHKLLCGIHIFVELSRCRVFVIIR